MSESHDEAPISEARDHLTELVSRAAHDGQITYITRRGRRMAAIVPLEVAEAADAAEDAYLSALASDSQAELDAGGRTRPLAAVVTDLAQHSADDSSLPPPQRRSPDAAERDHVGDRGD
jgi:prevent-host-death family protein